MPLASHLTFDKSTTLHALKYKNVCFTKKKKKKGIKMCVCLEVYSLEIVSWILNTIYIKFVVNFYGKTCTNSYKINCIVCTHIECVYTEYVFI